MESKVQTVTNAAPLCAHAKAMVLPDRHLDISANNYKKMNTFRGTLYLVVAGMAIGSLFAPLYVRVSSTGARYEETAVSYFKSVRTWYNVGGKEIDHETNYVADSSCRTYKVRLQSGCSFAMLAIAMSCLSALFCFADSTLIGFGCFRDTFGPKGFGLSSFTFVCATAGALAVALSIVAGHYYSKNPCNYSYTSLSDDNLYSLGSGFIVTVVAFLFVIASEAGRFYLIKTHWAPPMKHQLADIEDKADETCHVTVGGNDGVISSAVSSSFSRCRGPIEAVNALVSPYTGQKRNRTSEAGENEEEEVFVDTVNPHYRRINLARSILYVCVMTFLICALCLPLFATETTKARSYDNEARRNNQVESHSDVTFWARRNLAKYYFVNRDPATGAESLEYYKRTVDSESIEDLPCAGVGSQQQAAIAFTILSAVTVAVVGALSMIDSIAIPRERLPSVLLSWLPILGKIGGVIGLIAAFSLIVSLSLLTNVFYEARCNGQLALANRGYTIDRSASNSGYLFVVVSFSFFFVFELVRFLLYASGVVPSTSKRDELAVTARYTFISADYYASSLAPPAGAAVKSTRASSRMSRNRRDEEDGGVRASLLGGEDSDAPCYSSNAEREPMKTTSVRQSRAEVRSSRMDAKEEPLPAVEDTAVDAAVVVDENEVEVGYVPPATTTEGNAADGPSQQTDTNEPRETETDDQQQKREEVADKEEQEAGEATTSDFVGEKLDAAVEVTNEVAAGDMPTN